MWLNINLGKVSKAHISKVQGTFQSNIKNVKTYFNIYGKFSYVDTIARDIQQEIEDLRYQMSNKDSRGGVAYSAAPEQ